MWPANRRNMDERRKVANLGPVGVWVWQGDITAAGTEGIVNAANNEGLARLRGGRGHPAGGRRRGRGRGRRPGLLVSRGPDRPRPARRPRGQGDPHAAAMAPGRPASAEAVGSATAAALGLAAAEGLASVALPALGTGVGGVPLEAVAAAMAAAVRDHAAGPGRFRRWCSSSTTGRPWSGSGPPSSGSWGPAMDPELDHLAAGRLLERICCRPGRWSALPTATSA